MTAMIPSSTDSPGPVWTRFEQVFYIAGAPKCSTRRLPQVGGADDSARSKTIQAVRRERDPQPCALGREEARVRVQPVARATGPPAPSSQREGVVDRGERPIAHLGVLTTAGRPSPPVGHAVVADARSADPRRPPGDRPAVARLGPCQHELPRAVGHLGGVAERVRRAHRIRVPAASAYDAASGPRPGVGRRQIHARRSARCTSPR